MIKQGDFSPCFSMRFLKMSKENKVLFPYRANFDGVQHFPFDRCGIYGMIISLLGAEQFTWSNVPDTMNSHCIERAVNTGLAVAYNVPDDISAVNRGFTVTPCSFVGVLNNTGMTNTVITYGTDYSMEIDLTKNDAVLIKNNDYMYNEYINMFWFADMLARTDNSEKALITWSKMHPIAKATSGIDSAKLKEILQNIIDNDDMYNVISDNSKMLTGTPTTKDDSVLRLTDENAVEKMHFLSEFHYELIRRYCNLYNMPFRTNAKSAQSLESELHNTDVFSQAINQNRLKCRQEAAQEIHDKLGIDLTVDYSEILKKENKIIDSNVQEEIIEAQPNANVSRGPVTGDENGKTNTATN